jgi:glycosyltransferase involved in cell wall biosynthesis
MAKVGVICHSPSTQMSAQYDALADLREFEIVVLFRNREQGNAAWTPHCPKRVRYDFLPPPTSPLIPRRVRQLFNDDIRPMLEAHDFDAMILHGMYDSSAVRQAVRWCRSKGRPYVFRCDANVEKERALLRRTFHRIMMTGRVKRAAALLYMGTQNRRYYELFGGREEQFFLAPWEFDYHNVEQAYREIAPLRDRSREELGLADRVVVVTIGRLLALKGFQTLVPAIARLAAEGRPVHLLVAGDGPYRAELESLIASHQAPVTLLGNVDRSGVVRALTAGDVFVLASTQEAWGLVVNEAALCGLPLVCSDAVGAAPDLVLPGENGDIFPAGDVDRLCEILRSLCDDPSKRAAMGRRSQEVLHRWRTDHRAVEGYAAALRHALKMPAAEGSGQ